MKKVVIIGAGGHAKVVIDIILQRKKALYEEIEIVGILDDSFSEGEDKKLFGISIIGKLDKISELEKSINYVIAIGNNEIREKISKKFKELNYITLIHPRAIIAEEVTIGEGTVVMAGAVINSYTKIGKHNIINTSSIIEHDNNLDDYIHISPNSTLCGGVKVGKSSWIGAGATIIQGVEISNNVLVGAGAVVLRNIEKNLMMIGILAKEKVRN
ncbi:MAG: acetyltransferase [Fusobacteriaceae bacterium]